MQVEIASSPPGPVLRLSWATASRLTLPAVILVTLLVELALAERKYALFGGGFGQSQALDAPVEIALFILGLLLSHSLLLYLLYRMFRRLHGSRADSPVFHLNFAFLTGAAALGITVAKYQALSYFSDAMSLQIVRNLSGGSLTDALLYGLSEAGLILIVSLAALLIYAGVLWLVRRRWRAAPPLPDRYRLGAAPLVLLVAAVPFLLFACNRVDDVRSGLSRFNSVILLHAVLEQLTDFDRDGWSWFSHPVDLQPLDGSRHPYALDVPNNGVDEDGYGGDLAFTDTLGPARPPTIAGRKRHVILIVLESTRADMIGRRIDGRPVAPILEALGRSGSVAREAYSHVGFTSFSLQSLFTGQLAPTDDQQSLVRDFLANGYKVGVFSGQGEDFGGTARIVGLRRAQTYVDAMTLREHRITSSAALNSLAVDGKALLREFDRRLGRPEQWRNPLFLYFNFQSAHFPYAWEGMERILPGDPIPRGEISLANREWLERTYWNAVAYNDRLIGQLLSRLERLRVRDDSLIVVTGDHGESLFDDGFLGHGHMLNAEQTRIPFILSDRGVPLPPTIGLANMRGIILRAAGATTSPEQGPVFQYLGTLDRPGTIGTVSPGGNWTIFNLYREAVWTSRSRRWIDYSDLAAGSRERRAADALIGEWARQRWLQRLRAAPGRS